MGGALVGEGDVVDRIARVVEELRSAMVGVLALLLPRSFSKRRGTVFKTSLKK